MIREVNKDNNNDINNEALHLQEKMLRDNKTVVGHTLDIDLEFKKINEKHQKKMTKLKKKLKTTQQRAWVTSLKSIVK